MTRVPRTVPSTPLSVMASSRQIIRKEAAMKRPRKHHGASAPVLSIHVKNELNGRSLARYGGRAKTVLRCPCASSSSSGMGKQVTHTFIVKPSKPKSVLQVLQPQ